MPGRRLTWFVLAGGQGSITPHFHVTCTIHNMGHRAFLGDFAVQAGIVGSVNGTHTAAAEHGKEGLCRVSSANKEQIDLRAEWFEFVPVDRNEGTSQSACQRHREAIGRRNPSSLCFEYACGLPERRVQIVLNADSRCENGANGGFGGCGSAGPVEIVIDFANVYGVCATIVQFVENDLPNDFSADFATEERDHGAGIENVNQRKSPLTGFGSSSSISAALRSRKSPTLVGTWANRP